MKHIGTYSKFIVRNGEVCRNEKMSEVFSNMWQQWNLKKNSMTGTLLVDTGLVDLVKCGKPRLDLVVNHT